MEAVINVAAVIPAENLIALTVAETVFDQNFFIHRGQLIELVRGEFAVKFVKSPDDSAFGDKPGCDNAVTNLIVDETKFCRGMNHNVPFKAENETIGEAGGDCGLLPLERVYMLFEQRNSNADDVRLQ